MQQPSKMAICRTLLLIAVGSCVDTSSASAATSSHSTSAKLPRKTPAALLRRESKRNEPESVGQDGFAEEVFATGEPGYDAAQGHAAQAPSEKLAEASHDAAPAAASDDLEPSAAPTQARSRRPHVQVHDPSAEPRADAAFSETETRKMAPARMVSASRPASQIAASDADSAPVQRAGEELRLDTIKTTPPLATSSNKGSSSDAEMAAEKEVAALKVEEEVADEKEAAAEKEESDRLADKMKKGDSCSKYSCPAGFKLKDGSSELYCLASPCGTQDTEACCDVEVVHVNLNATRYELGEPAGMCEGATMITNETECFHAISLLIVGPGTTLDWENYHGAQSSSTDPTLPANCIIQKTAPFVFRPIWNGASPVKNGDETLIPICKKALFGMRGPQGSVGLQGTAGSTGLSGIQGPEGPHGPKGKAAPPPEGLVPINFLAGLIAVNLLSGAMVYYVGQKELVQKQDVLGRLPGFSKIEKPAAESDSWDQWEEEENWDIDHGDEAYDTSK